MMRSKSYAASGKLKKDQVVGSLIGQQVMVYINNNQKGEATTAYEQIKRTCLIIELENVGFLNICSTTWKTPTCFPVVYLTRKLANNAFTVS